MKRAEQLTREQLEAIVNAVQDRLFPDLVNDRDTYKASKELDLADTVWAIRSVYDHHGLVPGAADEPIGDNKAGLYVVFSLAVHDLGYGHALPYEEAVEVAERLNDACIVKVWDGEDPEHDDEATGSGIG
jgi:hypothetical protein